jgi:hypothetical protein
MVTDDGRKSYEILHLVRLLIALVTTSDMIHVPLSKTDHDGAS